VDWLRELHSPLLSFKLGIDFIAPRFGLAPEPSPYLLLFGLVLEDLKSILSPTPPVIMLLVGFCYYASGGFLLRSVFFNLRSVEICLLQSSVLSLLDCGPAEESVVVTVPKLRTINFSNDEFLSARSQGQVLRIHLLHILGIIVVWTHRCDSFFSWGLFKGLLLLFRLILPISHTAIS
jgi:hypothetical protein